MYQTLYRAIKKFLCTKLWFAQAKLFCVLNFVCRPPDHQAPDHQTTGPSHHHTGPLVTRPPHRQIFGLHCVIMQKLDHRHTSGPPVTIHVWPRRRVRVYNTRASKNHIGNAKNGKTWTYNCKIECTNYYKISKYSEYPLTLLIFKLLL